MARSGLYDGHSEESQSEESHSAARSCETVLWRDSNWWQPLLRIYMTGSIMTGSI